MNQCAVPLVGGGRVVITLVPTEDEYSPERILALEVIGSETAERLLASRPATTLETLQSVRGQVLTLLGAEYDSEAMGALRAAHARLGAQPLRSDPSDQAEDHRIKKWDR